MTVDESYMLERLRLRYGGGPQPTGEWAFLTHVRSETGFSGPGRTADAIAMNLWPSRGLAVHGFEVKCSRRDWVREMKKPEKAEAIAAYCDRWWLVVSDADFVKPGELPDGWGLLALKGHRLVGHHEAPRQEAKPIDRRFLAALMRAASTGAGSASEAITQARSEGFESGFHSASQRLDRVTRERDELYALIRAFGETTGISMRTWNGLNPEEGRRVGGLVNMIEHGEEQVKTFEKRLERVAEDARRIYEQAEERLATRENE